MSAPLDDELLSAARTNKQLGPGGDGEVLRSEREDWERRARIADGAANDLASAVLRLQQISPANYFGECVEGREVFRAFGDAIQALNADVQGQVVRARALSESCTAASRELDDIDARAAASIES